MLKYNSYQSLPEIWNLEVPSHWEIKPLYAFAKIKSITNCTDLPLLSVYLDAGVIPFSSRSEKRTNTTSTDLSKYQRVDPGDFVLNNQQAWRGSVGVSRHTGIVSPAYLVLSLDDSLNKRFANYLFRSRFMVGQYVRNSKGVGSIQRNLYWNYLKRDTVFIPTIDEQEQIVRFLDWQLSKINRLIYAKKQQIELIKESQQKLIDATVLPETSNNDSIMVPDGWEIKKFNFVFNFRKGLNITKANLEEEGVPVISYGQVHSKANPGTRIDDSLIRYVNRSYLSSNSNALVKPGEFIFADTSEDFEGVGNCVYVDRDEELFAGYHTLVVSPKDKEENRYFAYLFKSSIWRYQLRKNVNGVKVFSITQKILKNAYVLVPPTSEKNRIVEFLDEQCSRLDKLIHSIGTQIELLKEHEARLIADVVSGGVDVRSVKIPDYEYVEEVTSLEEEDYDEIQEDEEE